MRVPPQGVNDLPDIKLTATKEDAKDSISVPKDQFKLIGNTFLPVPFTAELD